MTEARQIRFNEPYVTGSEIGYIEQVIESRVFAGNGPFTKACERLLEDRYAVPNVLLTHSCTGALELAALIAGVGPGDEVIIPSYTFPATASAFLRTGASLVFCEVDAASMTIDVADVERRMTERTRVIVPVHYGGIAADMDGLAAVTDGRGVKIIEDAAQGLDAKLGERWLGTIGETAAFSFHETKNLHAGLSGALFLNDENLFERAEDMWERGTNRAKMIRGIVDKYSWVELGSSFYPSELQAAFLLAQLEHMEENAAERRPLFDAYDRTLREHAQNYPFVVPSYGSNRSLNAHSYFILGESFAITERMRIGLLERGVAAYIGFVPLHSSRMGQRLGYEPLDLPVTESAANRVLRMPLHNSMSVSDVEFVVESLIEVFS
jgi:dTDP-4-amino-4,6-dideoxygalactose transaminase